MIHRIFDPDRAWQSRIDSDRARRAMEDERHERNARTSVFFAEVLGFTIMGVVFAWGLASAYRAGLFAWIN